jgi:hypothetical protein
MKLCFARLTKPGEHLVRTVPPVGMVPCCCVAEFVAACRHDPGVLVVAEADEDRSSLGRALLQAAAGGWPS